MFLRTLGGARLEGALFTRPKPLLLLAYLAIEGPQKRRNVAELFWPQAANYLKSLNVAVAQLRRELPGAVCANRDEIWTELDCDAKEFLGALATGDDDKAEQLYRGPFLDGYGSRGLGVELEEWIFSTRERLALALSRHLAEANLAPPANSFVGRHRELVRVAQLLSRPETKLVTIVGPGGVGKTRLAQAVAHQALPIDTFSGGVFFLSLDSVPDPAALEARLDGLLGGRHLGESDVLLVLDNFDHLVSAAPELSRLMDASPRLTLLVTSRARLNIAAEVIFPLAGLPCTPDSGGTSTSDASLPEPREHTDPTGPTDPTDPPDAIRLFLERASQVSPDSVPDRAQLPLVAQICRLVGGLPLGLELAASWLRVLTLPEIVAALERTPSLLASPLRDVPPRHRSFGAVFEGSWTLLDENEQDTARRLSVLEDTWELHAAARVAGASAGQLRGLVDKSIVKPSRGGRFCFHPLIAGYLNERLSEDPCQDDVVREEHARYYLGLAEGLVKVQMFESGHRAALNSLETELENVRSAWWWTLGRGAFEVADLPAVAFGLQEFFDRRGRLAEGSEFFERSRRILRDVAQRRALRTGHSPTVMPSVLGNVLVNGAYLDYRLGRLTEARAKAGSGLGLLPPDDMWGRITGKYALGLTAGGEGKSAQAEKHLRRSLALARQLDTPFGRAGVNSLLHALSTVHNDRGRLELAKQGLEKALELSRGQGNSINVVRALTGLANISRKSGEADAAHTLVRESLEQARRAELRDLLPQGQLLRAELALDDGNVKEGRMLLAEVFEAAQEIHDPWLLARTTELLHGGNAHTAI